MVFRDRSRFWIRMGHRCATNARNEPWNSETRFYEWHWLCRVNIIYNRNQFMPPVNSWLAKRYSEELPITLEELRHLMLDSVVSYVLISLWRMTFISADCSSDKNTRRLGAKFFRLAGQMIWHSNFTVFENHGTTASGSLFFSVSATNHFWPLTMF